MCRPRPVTALTTPMARSVPGTSALTSVDLPTPLWPSSTLMPALEQLAHRRHVVAALGHDVGHVERAVGREQLVRRCQVGLGQHQQRVHALVVRRDEGPVDQPDPGLGVGERDDHDELGGVGDDHPLDGVVVVRGAAQRGRPLVDRRRCGPASRRRPTRRRRAARGRPRRRPCGRAAATSSPSRRSAVDVAGEAAAVDGDHHAGHGVVVRRAVLGAGAGAAARPVERLGVDVVVVRPGVIASSRRAACDQAPGKSVKVLDVVAMFSTRTPSTASPRITPACAIRWSA